MTPVTDLRAAVEAAAAGLANGGATKSPPTLERPKQADHGDYATNAALVLAPVLKAPPREVAERLGGALRDRLGEALERVEVAGPGLPEPLPRRPVVRRGARLGAGGRRGLRRRRRGAGAAGQRRVRLGQPDGPADRGQRRATPPTATRSRACSASPATTVAREYYFNDAGTQIEKLGESIRARARGRGGPRGRLRRRLRQRAGGADPRRGRAWTPASSRASASS